MSKIELCVRISVLVVRLEIGRVGRVGGLVGSRDEGRGDLRWEERGACRELEAEFVGLAGGGIVCGVEGERGRDGVGAVEGGERGDAEGF